MKSRSLKRFSPVAVITDSTVGREEKQRNFSSLSWTELARLARPLHCKTNSFPQFHGKCHRDWHVKYCDQRICMSFVCLFVCLSARISKKTTQQISLNFLYITDYLRPLLGLPYDGNAVRYVPVRLVSWMTSCFFQYNGENRPESKTTCMFRQDRQVAAPGTTSAVSDCILFLSENITQGTCITVKKITSEPPQRFHGTFTYIAVTGSRPLFCRQTLFPFLPRPYFLLSLPSPLSSSFSLSTSHYFTLSFHSSNYFFHAVIHEI